MMQPNAPMHFRDCDRRVSFRGKTRALAWPATFVPTIIDDDDAIEGRIGSGVEGETLTTH